MYPQFRQIQMCMILIAVFVLSLTFQPVMGQAQNQSAWDVQAYLEKWSQRTMVPTRFIAEDLGATVSWHASDRTITLDKDTTQIELQIGQSVANVNGQQMKMDTAPFIRQDRTFVPLRFVSETFGAKVKWDINGKIVKLTAQDKQIEISIDHWEERATGRYVGQADPHTIEIETAQGPLALQLTIEMQEEILGIRENESVTVQYYQNPNQQYVLTWMQAND